MSAPEIFQPHDALIRYTFAETENAASLLQAHLPAEIAAAIQWESLELQSGSFLDEELRRTETDLLFAAQFAESGADETMLLYLLFEHQSTVDRQMPLRLWRYLGRIYEREFTPEAGFPPVLAIIFSHAPGGWKIPTDFAELLHCPPRWRTLLTPFHPHFRYLVIDLAKLEMDDLRGNTVVRLAVSLVKAASEGRTAEWVTWAAPLLNALGKATTPTGFLEALLRYVFNGKSDLDWRKIRAKVESLPVLPEARHFMMTIAEIIRLDGRQEGERMELIRNILSLQALLDDAAHTETSLNEMPMPALQQVADEIRCELQKRLARS